MYQKLSDKTIFCQYCGSVQVKGFRYCSSCGADMQELAAESRYSGVRIVNETPLTHVDLQNLDATTSTTSGNYAYGSATGGTYRTYSTSTPYRTNKEYANIALIFGVIGFIFSCFLFPLIGLSYVRKAERNHEDPSTIRIAKILNWIQLILTIIGIIFWIVYLIGNSWWFYY